MGAHVERRQCGTQMACFGIQQRNLARTRAARDNTPPELQLPVPLMRALHSAAHDAPSVGQVLQDIPNTVGTCCQGTERLYRARFMVKQKMGYKGASSALAYGDTQSSQELGGSHMSGRTFFRQLEQRFGYPPLEKVSFCAHCEEVRAVHVEDEDHEEVRAVHVEDEDHPLPPKHREDCPVCKRALNFFHGMDPVPFVRAFLEVYRDFVVSEAQKAKYRQELETPSGEAHSIVLDWIGGNCAKGMNLDAVCPYSAAFDGVQNRKDKTLPSHQMVVLEILSVPAFMRILQGSAILAVVWSTGKEQGGKWTVRPVAQWLQGKLNQGVRFEERDLRFRLAHVLADSPASAHNAGINIKGKYICHACCASAEPGQPRAHYYFPKPGPLRDTAHFRRVLTQLNAVAPSRMRYARTCLHPSM